MAKAELNHTLFLAIIEPLVTTMTKSELIEVLAHEKSDLSFKDVEAAVKALLEHMSESLADGERIEIRGFGSFSLHYRPPRTGRNPKTGAAVELAGKYVPHFKPGKELRNRVNEAAANERKPVRRSSRSATQ